MFYSQIGLLTGKGAVKEPLDMEPSLSIHSGIVRQITLF